MNVLEFDRVSYRYDGEETDIVDELSFAVKPGAFHCILGVSGCGKSTIFRMTNGLLKPRKGTIRVGGAPIETLRHYCGYMPQKDLLFPWRSVGENLALPMEIARTRKGTIRVGGAPIETLRHYCGYMPQKDLLFPWRSVGENLALPMEIARTASREERAARVDAALAQVGLAGCRDKRPDELSGGMRQRAAFARTMLTGSDLLLLDEPFSALDFLTRISMQEWLLEQWRQTGKTILFIIARTMLTGSDLLLLDEPFSALDFLTRISMQEWLLEQWRQTGKTILFITHDVEEALFLSTSVLMVEESPIRALREIPVPLDSTRTRTDLARPEIVALQQELIDMLRKQVAL